MLGRIIARRNKQVIGRHRGFGPFSFWELARKGYEYSSQGIRELVILVLTCVRLGFIIYCTHVKSLEIEYGMFKSVRR